MSDPVLLQPSPKPRPPRAQFGLAGLMLMMLVVSVTLAPASYLVRAARGEPGMQLTGILLVLTAPMLLVVLISVCLTIHRRLNR